MLKEFAEKLNAMKLEYGYPFFPEEVIKEATEKGIVIVSGASDDLIELEGAIRDEGDCYDGGDIYLNKNGIIFESCDAKMVSCIHAEWCKKKINDKIIPWSYLTDIPHEQFFIYEENRIYCEGIVFFLKDVK